MNPGVEVTLTVEADAATAITYQWRRNQIPLADGNSQSFHIQAVGEGDQGSYDVIVKAGESQLYSEAALLMVNDPVQIITQPISASMQEGGDVEFRVLATGSGQVTYQWFHGDVAIADAKSETLKLRKVGVIDSGIYRVHVNNALNELVSDPASLTLVSWREVAGTYQGLLHLDGPVQSDGSAYSGRITVTMSATGAASGRLEYRGLSYPLVGHFSSAMQWSLSITRPNQPSIFVQLGFDRALAFTASVVEGANAVLSEANLTRWVVHSGASPAPQAGRYTLQLAAVSQVAPLPTAPGYLTVQVKNSGRMIALGRLPDGARLHSGALIYDDGQVAFCQALYPAGFPVAGYLCGPLKLTANGGALAPKGNLHWHKPVQTTGAYWRAGLDGDLAVEGSFYKAPATGQRVLTLGVGSDLAQFSLSGPIVGGQFQRAVHLGSDNRVRVDSPNVQRLTLRLIPSRGVWLSDHARTYRSTH